MANDSTNYKQYHLQVINAEEQIASENYQDALQLYEDLFEQYEFIFLRDYQRAVQVAHHLGDKKTTADLMRRSILAGWSIKSIKKNKYLKSFRKTVEWQSLNAEYHALRNQYEKNLNQELRNRVQKMFSADQKKAMGALFKFSSEAQDRYGEMKFAPHSREQMRELMAILESFGYPGEQIIGNDIWMSTILSHHNSISRDYVTKDTLYPLIKPMLLRSLEKGQISPFELALVDEWYLTVKSGWSAPKGYGILSPPSSQNIKEFNNMRKEIFMRSIDLRNRLVDIENKTGMDLYLQGQPWVEGKIEILPDEK